MAKFKIEYGDGQIRKTLTYMGMTFTINCDRVHFEDNLYFIDVVGNKFPGLVNDETEEALDQLDFGDDEEILNSLEILNQAEAKSLS